MMRRLMGPVLLAILTACDSSASGGGAACGLAAVAGATALLNEFGVPNQTLGVPPEQLPGRLVVRFVAGPARPAVAGRADSVWAIGVEGSVPAGTAPGFGVLVFDASQARGVMIYEGLPVEGAPQIGTVTIEATTVPLIGLRIGARPFEDPRCPFFPDSVIK